MASRENWAKRVEQWAKSGLTARQFGAREGFDGGQLPYWASQLGKSSGDPTKQSARKTAARSFLPARLVEMSSARVSEPVVEVELEGGCVIRIGVGADLELVERVFALVSR